MRSLVHSVVAAVMAVSVVGDRQVVSLDFGWRVADAHNLAPPNCSFPISFNGVRCMNLNGVGSAGDPVACAAAACAQGAQVWQFAASEGGCWVGDLSNCNGAGPDAAWVGAGTNASGAPPANAPPAQRDYDDSSWLIVDTPHDATIVGNFSKSDSAGEAFLPPAVSYYRKHFRAPAAWAGSVVTIELDASLSTSTFWLNGNQLVVAKPNGYLPLVLRLDNAGLNFSDTLDNIFVAYVDGSKTTGWWYEGSGLLRHNRLVVTAAAAYVAPFGIASPHFVENIVPRAAPAAGLTGDVTLTPSVDLLTGGARTSATVSWVLYAADGVTRVASAGPTSVTIDGTGTTLLGPAMAVAAAELWSVPRPYLHTLVTTVSVGGSAVDSRNESVGFRAIAWSAEQGLFLNNQRVKMRGFCNHESWAGVGAALPDRIDLHRVQQMRGVGGNAWRTSHNPPEPVLLALADRLGIVVLDENRVLATNANCDGCANTPSYSGDPAADMYALALRDRNHASVIFYSECNEAGCGNGSLLAGDLVEHVKEAAYTADGSRAVAANMGWISPIRPRTPMSDALDVMGFSHASYNDVLTFHEAEPDKPLVMSECCSCETQRGEDADMPHNTSEVFYSNENSGCLAGQTQVSDGPEWMSGTFVWTMHDYVGEPDKWPHVSSSFGSYDLAGFPKAPVWWYRSWWLANISTSDAGRPALAAPTAAFAHIVEAWQAPVPPATSRTIHVYSNAPWARLTLPGGATLGPVAIARFGAAVFHNVPFSAGTLRADALAADGSTVLASDAKPSWGAPAAIVLSVDAPSLLTGTGGNLYLDGGDVALVRATVVDASGAVCHDSTAAVSFACVSGPCAVWGTGNGDPNSREPYHAATRFAYHGLVRAVVRATLVAAGTPDELAALALVNPDAGKGNATSSILTGGAAAPTAIVLTASAPGLKSATISISLSVDPADAPLAVAERSVASADIGA